MWAMFDADSTPEFRIWGSFEFVILIKAMNEFDGDEVLLLIGVGDVALNIWEWPKCYF
jgi:hypothetical protein